MRGDPLGKKLRLIETALPELLFVKGNGDYEIDALRNVAPFGGSEHKDRRRLGKQSSASILQMQDNFSQQSLVRSGRC